MASGKRHPNESLGQGSSFWSTQQHFFLNVIMLLFLHLFSIEFHFPQHLFNPLTSCFKLYCLNFDPSVRGNIPCLYILFRPCSRENHRLFNLFSFDNPATSFQFSSVPSWEQCCSCKQHFCDDLKYCKQNTAHTEILKQPPENNFIRSASMCDQDLKPGTKLMVYWTAGIPTPLHTLGHGRCNWAWLSFHC